MIISVASGKGGTGKTTIAVNLALALGNAQVLDCDVEEPNAHLFLHPEIKETRSASVLIPEVEKQRCNFCGHCQRVCAYHAIAVIPPKEQSKGGVLFFPHLCHSCGACAILCPQGAIREIPKEIGTIELGSAGQVQFVHGRLNVGEAMSPPLIRQVKEFVNSTRTVIIDAPPGTSCPVVASVKGSDYTILVTEPTPFGLNDLVLAVEVLKKLQIPFGVVINRSDIGDDKMESYCRESRIPVLMRVPFDREIAELYSNGIPFVLKKPEYSVKFKDMFNMIKEEVAK
ncbi:MAG: ATP-binding protein [Candidatus Omnitrophica bacterium]|nr:ATP-binding protein [Candidatus Omnitrophota bacterium]